MKNAMLRILWLPFDIILLSIDFLVLTRWRVVGGVAKMFGVMGPHSGPFCRKRWRCCDDQGRTCRLCGHAQRYRNREIFSLLCCWVSVVNLNGPGVVGVCSRRKQFRPSALHYVTSAVLLGIVWVSFGRLILCVVL